MTIGIIGALDDEVALILDSMTIDGTEEAHGTRYIRGIIGAHRAVVVKCSVGKVNAALCTQTLILKYGVDCVVNLGLAGAVGEGLSVLSVVISGDAVFHDQDPIMLKYPPKTKVFKADDNLIVCASDTCRAIDGLSWRVGRVATGDLFVQSGTVKRRIQDECLADCVEMEGAAVAHVCHMNGVPFLIIRTMSDSADERGHMDFDRFLIKAAEQSARIMLGVIDRIK